MWTTASCSTCRVCPPTSSEGRRCWGDAAHGMAPNLGRGACEALLDAIALVGALAEASDVVSALHAYEPGRRPRGGWCARHGF
ncbi:FAD-dependent monooxygenase [Arthrobacter sp. zg-Y820]|nr:MULTISPECIES: FAD-dependent monooxygenase [unclassified Arthrobacter]MCC9197133.1 FAD-dependent monooxygenase [Arthrobacter sp. zg-Y820]MDK1279998.1 FAD-dependent monooxygenase [Arthrobacter sp. zg.Y820]WIB11202.1 FAD-dependent monooxygenase [Arthrobacter sp. zg-Y820]